MQAIYPISRKEVFYLDQIAKKVPKLKAWNFGLAVAMFLRMTGIIPSFLNMLVTVIVTVAFGIYMAKRKEAAK